jgi:hypothetical protein
LSKTKSKPKIQATIDDLVAKIKTARAKLKGVHNSKTRAKIKADIAAALAEIKRLRAKLRAIPDEKVNVKVNPVIGFSKHSLAVMIKKNTSAVAGWQATALDGGGTSRTGGPTSINVEAPNVNMRMYVDGREIRPTIMKTVSDVNSRNAFRARVGRR